MSVSHGDNPEDPRMRMAMGFVLLSMALVESDPKKRSEYFEDHLALAERRKTVRELKEKLYKKSK